MFRISLRNLVANKLRLLLSGIAVVLGVAFVSGTMVFTDTLDKTFTDLFETTAADVNVEPAAAFETGLAGTAVGGSRPSLPASLVDQIRDLDGVSAVEGYVQAEGVYVLDRDGEVLDTGGAPGIGTNWPEERSITPATLVSGRAPAGSDEVALDTGTIEKADFEVGDTVTVMTTGPRLEAELVGIVRFGDDGGLAGASLTFFDMDTAQRLMLERGRFTGIGLATTDGASDAEVADRVTEAIGQGYDVRTRAEQAQDLAATMEESLSFMNVFLLVFAGVALFVGSFLILNTFSMLIAQRTRELALFRALGASRRQTTLSVLGEALVLGLLGGVTGLFLGYGLALGLKALFGRMGLTLDGSLVFAADTVAWSMGIGVLVTLVAAYVPARRAAKVPPVAAMNPEVRSTSRSLQNRLRLGLPMVCIGLGALIAAPVVEGETAAAVAGAGGWALVGGAIALSPVIARPAIRMLSGWLPRLMGKTGQLARENALRNPRRTAATSSALMIGLALVTTFSIIGASAKASVDAAIGHTMQADYIVSTAVAQPFTPEVAKQLAAVDGVASVTRTRFGTARFEGTESVFVAYDPATVKASLDAEFVSGGFHGLRGRGLLVDEAVAQEHGWQLGDPVTFLTPAGEHHRLTVGGTFERNNALGTYLVSLLTYDATGGVPMDRYVYVNLAADADQAAVEGALEQVVAQFPIVDLKDAAAFEDEQRAQVDQMLLLINALLVLSVLIAVLGVVNTLVLSVLERTRELGLLRAVGMTRRQMRRMVRVESVVISLYGAVLGVALGTVFGVGLTRSLDSQGIENIVIPGWQLAAFVVLGALIGVAAAVFPARRASRLRVLDAIASQ